MPNSRLTVAIVATHGVYKRQNTKNTKAVRFVNSNGRFSVFPPIRTLRVLTTLSLAIKPVIKAVDTLQSVIPNGENIGTRQFPSKAIKLSAEFVTRFNLASNVCKNQIIIVAQNIIVKAFVAKSFAFCTINRYTFIGLGNL